jgi:hypothetical protein
VYDDGPDRRCVSFLDIFLDKPLSSLKLLIIKNCWSYSLLVVEAADRPGLLVDLVKIITDINIEVQSGEFDTEVVANFLKMFL